MIFIDQHKAAFGVEPICRVLTEHGIQIAPATYYATRSQGTSVRAVMDAQIVDTLRGLQADRVTKKKAEPESLYGYKKMWHWLRRNGYPMIARCTVARLMRQEGMRGITRQK